MVKLINFYHRSYPSILETFFEDQLCVRQYAGSLDKKIRLNPCPWRYTVWQRECWRKTRKEAIAIWVVCAMVDIWTDYIVSVMETEVGVANCEDCLHSLSNGTILAESFFITFIIYLLFSHYFHTAYHLPFKILQSIDF